MARDVNCQNESQGIPVKTPVTLMRAVMKLKLEAAIAESEKQVTRCMLAGKKEAVEDDIARTAFR